MNKETMDMLLVTAGIELAFVFGLIVCFLLWRMSKGKKADRTAAQQLVKSVKKNDKSRRESLLRVFGECYDMEDDELNSAVDEFINREHAFYKTMISVYVNRDATEFSKLSSALEEMVKPYSDLALSSYFGGDSDALEALQQQNEALGKELDESKKVMDELLSEYSATFDKEGEGKNPGAIKKNNTPSDQPEESEADSKEMNVADGTLELTVDTIVEDQEEESAGATEELDIDSNLVVEEKIEEDEAADLIVEEQDSGAEIEAELMTDTEFENSSDELDKSTNNEVALDELDEELEKAVDPT